MILRLHHHQHLAEEGGSGPRVRAFSWELDPCCVGRRSAHQGPGRWRLHSCETQHLVSQPIAETITASVSQLVKT